MQKRSARLLVAMAVVAGLLVVLSQLGGGGSQESFTGIPQDGTRLGREDATDVAAVIAYLVFGTVRPRLAGSDALKTADRR